MIEEAIEVLAVVVMAKVVVVEAAAMAKVKLKLNIFKNINDGIFLFLNYNCTINY
jgi:hypothetical protein